jgi:phospholipid/cholesterol/gamma-HCH transport system permease protein
VTVTALFTGGIMVIQAAPIVQRYGAYGLLGWGAGFGTLREIAPLLTALMINGRVGANNTAELGTMAVTEQIDALRALATNPVRKLVVPRVIATTLMFPLLTILSNALGILGGMLIAVANLHVSANYYMRSVIESVAYNDLASGIGKTFFFGFAVGLIACYNGLKTEGGANGVGRATTMTVVSGAITVLIMDFFLTKLFLAVF